MRFTPQIQTLAWSATDGGCRYVANQSQFRLSDEDILRLARQEQTFLKDEIDQLIEIKVTEPFEQEISGMKDVIVQLRSDIKDMMTKMTNLKMFP